MFPSFRTVVVTMVTILTTFTLSFRVFSPSILVRSTVRLHSTIAPFQNVAKRAPKVVAPIVVEARQVYTVEVPDITEIEDRAINSKRSSSSKDFCTRSGGYPDIDIKTDIYTLLYATQIRTFKEKQAEFLQDRSFIKYGTNEEDLDTWGM